MSVFAPPLAALLKSVSLFRPTRVDKDELDHRITKMLGSISNTSRQADVQKAEWEIAVRAKMLDIANNEGEDVLSPDSEYFASLYDLLDVVLTLAEQGACDLTSPLIVFQELVDTQTIPNCSIIFTWLELRVGRLTAAIAQSSNLHLLRTLNDVLRRLSKSSDTAFCGRIMQLLSSDIFPFGERSGVNLRGTFNIANQTTFEKSEDENDFYTTFWSLQPYFCNPFVISNPDPEGFSLLNFRALVDKVLPALYEATQKERLLTGAKGESTSTNADPSLPSARKRTFDEMMDVDGDPWSSLGGAGVMPTADIHFFPKFLTSRNLLEYEMADTGFRRAILLQLSIFLQHLTYYTAQTKAKWYTKTNASLQMNYDIKPDEEEWIKETQDKITEQLRSTMPNGKAFADTASLVLQRERNWTEWKNSFCPTIEKPGLPSGDVENARNETNRIGSEERPPIEEPLGSRALTEVWEWGYSGPRDLENVPDCGTPKDLYKKFQLEQRRIDQRSRTLAQQKAGQEAKLRAARNAQEAKAKAAAEAQAKEKKEKETASAVGAKSPPPVSTSSTAAVSAVLTTEAPSNGVPAPVLPAAGASAGAVIEPPSASAVASTTSTGVVGSTIPKPSDPPKPGDTLKPPNNAGAAPGTPGIEKGNPLATAPGTALQAIQPLSNDPQIAPAEERKASLSWRAFRLASRTHLDCFKDTLAGDLGLLIATMDASDAADKKEAAGRQN